VTWRSVNYRSGPERIIFLSVSGNRREALEMMYVRVISQSLAGCILAGSNLSRIGSRNPVHVNDGDPRMNSAAVGHNRTVSVTAQTLHKAAVLV
jgi:hypothetical protein